MAIKKIGGGIDSNGGKNNIQINGQFNSVQVESLTECAKESSIVMLPIANV